MTYLSKYDIIIIVKKGYGDYMYIIDAFAWSKSSFLAVGIIKVHSLKEASEVVCGLKKKYKKFIKWNISIISPNGNKIILH